MTALIKKHLSELLLTAMGFLLFMQIFVGMLMDGVLALLTWGIAALYMRKIK